MKQITEQREAISIVLASDVKTSHLVLNWQDCDVIESVIQALDPLGELTDALSAEKHITISAVRPLINRLTEEVLKEKDSDTSLTAQIKCTVKLDLETRYQSIDSDTGNLLDICTFLDPRFKELQSNVTLQEIIKQEMEKLYHEKGHMSDEANDQAIQPPPAKKKSWVSKILGPAVEVPSALTPSQVVDKEFDQYIHFPKLDLDTIPLEWWKINEKQFPLLSELARHYLCVCATSVPSERIFSTGGNVSTAARNSLKPHNVNKLIFLASNLK